MSRVRAHPATSPGALRRVASAIPQLKSKTEFGRCGLESFDFFTPRILSVGFSFPRPPLFLLSHVGTHLGELLRDSSRGTEYSRTGHSGDETFEQRVPRKYHSKMSHRLVKLNFEITQLRTGKDEAEVIRQNVSSSIHRSLKQTLRDFF